MRAWFLPLTVTAILGLSLARARCADGPNSDHLSPLNMRDKSINKYRSFLATKLGVTPYDCGRVLDTPSFGCESFVSVYSQTQNGRLAFYVSSVEATDNIWQRSKSMRDMGAAEAVGIRRMDADISETIANKIRQVWLKMLENARLPAPLGLEFEVDQNLEFSIEQPDGPSLNGELWIPPPGPKTRVLVDISDALREYCRAAAANRPIVAMKIEREATALLEQLK